MSYDVLFIYSNVNILFECKDKQTFCNLQTFQQKKHCHRRVAEHELNRASQQQQSKKARPLNNEMAYADTPKGAGINSGYALDAAKIQIKNVSCKYFCIYFCIEICICNFIGICTLLFHTKLLDN